MTLSDDPGPLYGDTTTSYGITDYDARSVVTKSGADLAQIEMFLAARGDWSSEKAISNMVFYLQCEDDEIIKINLDQRDMPIPLIQAGASEDLANLLYGRAVSTRRRIVSGGFLTALSMTRAAMRPTPLVLRRL